MPQRGQYGHALVAPIQEPVVGERLQDPPHRLDVLGVEGHVRAPVLQPVPDPLREALPLLLVGEDGVAANLVELLDAQGFDLGLPADAQLLLRLDLHRKAMGVPSGDPRDAPSLQGAVPAHQVLDRPADDVVQPGASVRGGRPLVEHEGLSVGGGLQRAAEKVLLPPPGQRLVLDLEEAVGKLGIAHGSAQLSLSPSGSPRRGYRGRGGVNRSPSGSEPVFPSSSGRFGSPRAGPGVASGAAAVSCLPVSASTGGRCSRPS